MVQATVLEKQISSLSVIEEQKFKTAKWFALYTKSRHEKVVDQELRKKGVETFLPLRRVTRHWSDRKKIIEDPLFKGYLFTHVALRDRLTVLNTAGVVGFVGIRRAEPFEVREKDIWTIRRFLQEEIQMDPFPYLREGRRVYIRSGPLKGAEGFIIRKDKHCRLVISLDLLMQSVSVEIDQACVEGL